MLPARGGVAGPERTRRTARGSVRAGSLLLMIVPSSRPMTLVLLGPMLRSCVAADVSCGSETAPWCRSLHSSVGAQESIRHRRPEVFTSGARVQTPLACAALKLDDAVGAHPRLPAMGYSNWYDTKCDVHAERFLEAADALERTGLKALGYTQINVDAGWALPHRDSTTHELVPDPRFFPNGMDGLEIALRRRGYQLGGYTDRGGQQCGPSPGSKGFEELDAALFMRWNLSYVKSDDCNATLEYAPAMSDYRAFASALRTAAASENRPAPYFLICGCKLGVGDPDPRMGWEQCPHDASQFATAWRVASDDYTWDNVLTNANINAGLAQFSGDGHFNDPDMLINQPLVPAGWPSADVCPNVAQWKTVRGRGFPPYSIGSKQARLQMSLWSMMAAPLILSMNVRNLSAYDLETYGNADVIAVDQDALLHQGIRLQGYNLTSVDVPSAPPTKWKVEVLKNYNIVRGQCEACNESPTGCCSNRSAPNPLVQYLSHGGANTLESCEGLCHAFESVTRRNVCNSFVWNSINRDCFGRLDTIFDIGNPYYEHSPGLYSGRFRTNGTFAAQPSSAYGNFSNTNIWGKKLLGGSFALLFLNVGPLPSPPLTCDAGCVQRLLGDSSRVPGTKYSVKDLWNNAELPVAMSPLNLSSPILTTDSIYMLQLTPLKTDDSGDSNDNLHFQSETRTPATMLDPFAKCGNDEAGIEGSGGELNTPFGTHPYCCGNTTWSSFSWRAKASPNIPFETAMSPSVDNVVARANASECLKRGHGGASYDCFIFYFNASKDSQGGGASGGYNGHNYSESRTAGEWTSWRDFFPNAVTSDRDGSMPVSGGTVGAYHCYAYPNFYMDPIRHLVVLLSVQGVSAGNMSTVTLEIIPKGAKSGQPIYRINSTVSGLESSASANVGSKIRMPLAITRENLTQNGRPLITQREKHSSLWAAMPKIPKPPRKILVKQGYHGGNDMGDWTDAATALVGMGASALSAPPSTSVRKIFDLAGVTAAGLEGGLHPNYEMEYRSPVLNFSTACGKASSDVDHCWGSTDAEVGANLKLWAHGLIDPMRKAGFTNLTQFALHDELGYNFDMVGVGQSGIDGQTSSNPNNITSNPRVFKRFHDYIKNMSGLKTPQEFGAKSWSEVVPITHDNITSGDKYEQGLRIRFYWTMRFVAWDVETWYAKATEALVAANKGQSFFIYTNWNNVWEERKRFLAPSPTI
eukprot:SAG31_NODE_286_length_18467_cov_41.317056_13_plen_1204_part_00